MSIANSDSGAFAYTHSAINEGYRAVQDLPYMDFIPSMVLPDGVIKGPAGDGRLSAIMRDDVAAAAAAVLISEGHEGQTYDLTGRESFSLDEAASLMSRFTGKAIRFEDERDEEAFASRAVFGAPEWEVRGWVSSYQAIRDGSLERVSPDRTMVPANRSGWRKSALRVDEGVNAEAFGSEGFINPPERGQVVVDDASSRAGGRRARLCALVRSWVSLWSQSTGLSSTA